jgi:single-stranded DNA-binding protein
VEGRLQSRDWETQDGQKRNTVEVVADNIQFLRMGQKSSAPQAAGQTPPPEEMETINLQDEPEHGQASKNGPDAGPGNKNEEVPF